MGEEEDEEEAEVVVGFVLGVFVDRFFLANLLGDWLDNSGNLRGLLLGPSFVAEVTMEDESAVLRGLLLSPSFVAEVAMKEEEDEEGEGVVFGLSSRGFVDDLEQVVVVVEQVVVMVEQVEVRAVVCGRAGTVGLMS